MLDDGVASYSLQSHRVLEYRNAEQLPFGPIIVVHRSVPAL